MNIKSVGYAAAIISTVLSGSVGIFVRNISANSYVITFSRVFIGLLLLSLIMMLGKKPKAICSVKLSFSIVLSGFLLSLTILCYTNAILSIPLATAAFLLYTAPLIAVGLAAIFLKERFTVLNSVILALTFIGFLFLIDFNYKINLNESKGYMWGAGASFCYALYIVFNRQISESVPVLVHSFYQLLFATIIIIPFLDESILKLTNSDYCWLIAVGVFQGFVAITLLVWALKHLQAIEYGTISYLEPVVAAVIGYSLYSERLGLIQLIGCAIVLFCGITRVVSIKTDA